MAAYLCETLEGKRSKKMVVNPGLITCSSALRGTLKHATVHDGELSKDLDFSLPWQTSERCSSQIMCPM